MRPRSRRTESKGADFPGIVQCQENSLPFFAQRSAEQPVSRAVQGDCAAVFHLRQVELLQLRIGGGFNAVAIEEGDLDSAQLPDAGGEGVIEIGGADQVSGNLPLAA